MTWIGGRLDDLAASETSARVTVESKVKVVVERCGASKRTTRLLHDLGDALDAAGIFYDPALTDSATRLDTRVRFSRTPLPGTPDLHLFVDERTLEHHLARNLQRIPGFEDLDVVDTQYPLPTGERIDILCRDHDTGGWAVVELKVAQPDRGVYEQAISYTETFANTPKARGLPVRAVVICGVADPDLERAGLTMATQRKVDLSWHVYELGITALEIATTVPRHRPAAAEPVEEPESALVVEPGPSDNDGPEPVYEKHYDRRPPPFLSAVDEDGKLRTPIPLDQRN